MVTISISFSRSCFLNAKGIEQHGPQVQLQKEYLRVTTASLDSTINMKSDLPHYKDQTNFQKVYQYLKQISNPFNLVKHPILNKGNKLIDRKVKPKS
jgi:hypothetical protein